jgi:hypothetical protein
MKPVLRTQREIEALNQARTLISGAIAQIDLRGADQNVTLAMQIVDTVMSSMTQGKIITSDKVYKTALRKMQSEILE